MSRLAPESTARVEEACRDLDARWERDVPLARHTSAGVGGPVPFVIQPRGAEGVPELVEALRSTGEEIRALGNGTNLLVGDDGGPWLILRFGGVGGEPRVDGTRVTAPAGMSLPWLARATAKAGLRGLEHAEGIPGTVGGSTVGNAGCYGRDMSAVVQGARLLREGRLERVELGADDFGYRSSPFGGDDLLLEIEMELAEDDPEAIRADAARHRRHRLASQPIGTRSAGCVFRNPGDDSAGRLIDAAGLKGERIGGARVSEVHANFLVNEGGATAADFTALIDRIIERVHERFGVELVPELRFWGVEGRS